MFRPPAILLINNDLSDSTQAMLERQLFIDETITGDEFDARLLAEPYYASDVKCANFRIMVIRALDNQNNRDQVDVVVFCKAGLVSILTNKLGPPGATYPVGDLDWGKLAIF